MPYYGHAYDMRGAPYYTGPAGTYPGWDDLNGKAKDPATLEDVDAYFSTALNGGAWADLKPEQRQQALAEAHRWLGSLCWKTEGCCGRDYDAAILMAVSELALALAKQPDLMLSPDPTPGLYVSEKHLGEMGKSFGVLPGKYGPQHPLLFQRLPWLGDLLGCWVGGNYGSCRVLSRC